MAQPRRQIFRQQAIQHYIRSNSQDILPKTISPLTFTIGWMVLFLIILAGLLIWLIPVHNQQGFQSVLNFLLHLDS